MKSDIKFQWESFWIGYLKKNIFLFVTVNWVYSILFYIYILSPECVNIIRHQIFFFWEMASDTNGIYFVIINQINITFSYSK